MNPRVDPVEAELRAGNTCMRVADDYTAMGEHDAALLFARQAHVHYERAAALRASQSEANQFPAGQAPTGTTEAA